MVLEISLSATIPASATIPFSPLLLSCLLSYGEAAHSGNIQNCYLQINKINIYIYKIMFILIYLYIDI